MDLAYFLQTTNLNVLFFNLFCNNRLPITPNDIGGSGGGVLSAYRRMFRFQSFDLISSLEITAAYPGISSNASKADVIFSICSGLK